MVVGKQDALDAFRVDAFWSELLWPRTDSASPGPAFSGKHPPATVPQSHVEYFFLTSAEKLHASLRKWEPSDAAPCCRWFRPGATAADAHDHMDADAGSKHFQEPFEFCSEIDILSTRTIIYSPSRPRATRILQIPPRSRRRDSWRTYQHRDGDSSK